MGPVYVLSRANKQKKQAERNRNRSVKDMENATKASVQKEYQLHSSDTGSAEVQVVMLEVEKS